MYLIMVEGVLAHLLRFLLGLYQLSSIGAFDDKVWSEHISLYTLTQRVQDAGLEVFLEGYNRHLRNAIAHGDFRYNPDTEEVHFENRSPHSGKLVWEQNISLEELVSLYAKLDDAYYAVSVYLQLCLLPALFAEGEK